MNSSRTNRRTASLGLPHQFPIPPLPRLVAAAAVLCLALALGAHGALAANLQSVLVSNSLPSTTSCVTPSSVSSFSPSDTVYVYFYALNMNSGDHATAHWINPSNQWAWTTTWNPLSSGGNWCFSGSITASQLATAGPWSVQIYINGQQVGQASFGIATQGSGGPTPTNPSYTGSFDAVDCAHAFGWAKDNNNPNATISVDLSIDGSFWATITAGDYRVDLANAGMGNHAWNEYSLPAGLHDGNQHTIRAKNSGSTSDVPGSPKTFQNNCGTTPPASNVTASWSPGGAPPQTLTSGQSFSVNWQVSGASQIQSRVCYGTSSDPASICQQAASSWQYSGPSSQTASLTAPSVSASQMFHFVVQAQAGNQTVYSAVAQSTVTGITTPPSGRNLWVYSADPTRTLRCPACSNQLRDFVVVVEKSPASANFNKYAITVLGDNLLEISSAGLSVVRTSGVNLQINSTRVFRNLDIPGLGLLGNMEAGTDTGWQDMTTVTPYIQASDQVLSVVHDVVGFFPVVGNLVGGAVSLQDLYGDLGSFWSSSGNVAPSTSMRQLMEDVNNNHVDNLMATRLRSSFDGHLVFGVQFVAIINDAAGTPQFFLKAKNTNGTFIGVEIGPDYSNPVVTRQ